MCWGALSLPLLFNNIFGYCGLTVRNEVGLSKREISSGIIRPLPILLLFHLMERLVCVHRTAVSFPIELRTGSCCFVFVGRLRIISRHTYTTGGGLYGISISSTFRNPGGTLWLWIIDYTGTGGRNARLRVATVYFPLCLFIDLFPMRKCCSPLEHGDSWGHGNTSEWTILSRHE